MRFEVTQRFTASPSEVIEAYLDPAWYDAGADLPNLGAPEVLAIERNDRRATSRIRFGFTGDLSPAVTAVIDPSKLTWVEVTEYDLAAATATFVLEPDHYAHRLTCRGEVALRADEDGTRRLIRADLRVKMPLVGGQVERAIVSGLEDHLRDEASLLSDWIAESR